VPDLQPAADPNRSRKDSVVKLRSQGRSAGNRSVKMRRGQRGESQKNLRLRQRIATRSFKSQLTTVAAEPTLLSCLEALFGVGRPKEAIAQVGFRSAIAPSASERDALGLAACGSTNSSGIVTFPGRAADDLRV
jgi:hypothetical protein